MAEKMEINKKKCLTPEFRTSYPSVFQPKAFEQQDPKFSVTMLFSKKTDLTEMKRAAHNAATEKWGPKEKWPKSMRWPFRDGNTEKADQPGYKDVIFVTASAKADNPPGVVDHQNVDIIDPKAFYAGCYARAELIAFAYEKMGNRGVSFSLQNLQKLRDGEKFGGRRDAKDVFDKVDDGSESADNYSNGTLEEFDSEVGF